MATLDNIIQFNDFLENDESAQPLTDVINQIMELPEMDMNETAQSVVKNMLSNIIFPDDVKRKMITSIAQAWEDESLTRKEAQGTIDTLRATLNDYVNNDLKPSEYKRELINLFLTQFFGIFDESLESYHSFDIHLPIKLDEGAQMPTYAMSTDACADIYAKEDSIIPPHSFSNKIYTGVHLQLPENWQARLAPRSSIGAKTPLRMSNSIAIIDPGYRGEIIILYDNLSDKSYKINKGDRIAQMWVEPVRRFNAIEVDTLESSERGDGGLGSTGK